MTDHAILAGGSFWGTEAVFSDVIGVTSVESGYIGGSVSDPTYELVCEGTTGHAEAIRIGYDPGLLRYDDLLDIFFAIHDPTTLNRQGNDRGTQYRSAIFPVSLAQEAVARAAIVRNAAFWRSKIMTRIEPIAIWYPAEDRHQGYWRGEGQRNPYCVATIPPKLQQLRERFAERSKEAVGA